MNSSDKWFRWCFNVFIFLLCAQLGLILTLKSAYMRAEKRMKNSEAKVEFQCGDFNKEENFWELAKNQFGPIKSCLDVDCPDSLWVSAEDEEVDLHILSVERARPTQWVDGNVEYGHFVEVDTRSAKKPYILVLVSQNLMQWTFKPHEEKNKNEDLVTQEKQGLKPDPFLKEIIVVGPELIWLEGLHNDTKITYFNRDQICAYPTAWEEIKNPDNQFRRLFSALKEYTGYSVKSFQGKTIGRQFKVPFRKLLAMERSRMQSGEGSRTLASAKINQGMQWKREGKTLIPKSFKFLQGGEKKSLKVPTKTKQAYFEQGSQILYLINNHQVGTWDEEKKKFQAMHLPLNLPALYWPTSMTFNPLTSELLVYNDDRGGEIFAYNVVTQEWRIYAEKVGYSLMALLFHTEKEELMGIQYFANKLVKIIRFDKQGKRLEDKPLAHPVDFSKRLWRAELSEEKSSLWLKVTHPAHPGGDVHPLPL